MLKKLYKHEFKYMYKLAAVIYIILIGLTFFNGIIMQFAKSENAIIETIASVTIIAYTLGIFAVILGTVILIFVRFYRHFFTNQGYLTFTLPVTTTEHLVCKFVTSFCLALTTIFTVLLSVELISRFSGVSAVEVIIDTAKFFFYGEFSFNIILICVYLIVALIATILIIFALLCVGQLFKNRVLGTIVAYVAYYFVTQIFGTIFLVVLMSSNMLDKLNDAYFVYETFIWVYIAYNIIVGAAAFMVSRYILNNKLNLE